MKRFKVFTAMKRCLRKNTRFDTDIELTPCDRAGGELEEEVLVVNEQTEVHHNVYCLADDILKYALVKYCLLMLHNCTPGDTAEKRVADTYRTIAGTCQTWRDVIAHCYKQIRANSYGPYRISPKMVSSFRISHSNEITGMACLHNRIYVTHCDSNTLTTWDCSDTDATVIAKRTVLGMKMPVDIVACPSMSMLYIVDAQKPPCIWKVVPHGETTPFEQFALHTDDKYEQLYGVAPTNGRISSATSAIAPISMSIRNKYLLITAHSILFKYNASDCFWLEDISLPANMMAFHAVETIESTFVVCHGPAVECKEISEIDRNCNMLRSFGFASRTPGYPRHLVVDGDGRIFVNDTTNGKIFILNRELKFPLEYVSNIKDSKTCTRLCLDSESGRLVVGERRSRDVRVFHVRKSPPSNQTDTPRLPWLNANH